MQKRSLLIAVLLIGGVARAAPADDLDEGLRLFEALEYREATPHLEAALAAPELPTGERARAALCLGIVALTYGDEAVARARFSRALSLSPELTLPEDASPKLSQLFEAARADLRPASPASASSAPVTAAASASTAPSSVDESASPTASSAAVGSAVNPVASPVADVAAPATDSAVEPEAPFYKQWWFWTSAAAGTVAVAAAVVAIVIWIESQGGGSPDNGEDPPVCDVPSGQGCARVRF